MGVAGPAVGCGTRRGEKLGRAAARGRSSGGDRFVPSGSVRSQLPAGFFFLLFLLCETLGRGRGGEEETRLLTTSKVIHLKTPFSSEQRLIAS